MVTLKKMKADNLALGVVLGLLGTVAGFFIFATYWSMVNNTSIGYFVENIFLGSPLFRDKIVTISVLFNVMIFYLAMRAKLYKISQGILLVILLSVPLIIYLN